MLLGFAVDLDSNPTHGTANNMARCLMAWEFGSGLGHASRLKSLADGFLREGHEVAFVLRDVVHAGALMRGLPAPVLQAPMWMHKTIGLPTPTVSLSEILLGNGYLKADSLDALVRGWQSAIDLFSPDVVVADYAPTAVIAARTRGVPCASVGNGFYVPPHASPLPAFMNWAPIAQGRLAYHEQLLLGSINDVLARHGAQPMTAACEALRADLPLLCTWPEIDPYHRPQGPGGDVFRGPTSQPAPGGVAAEWPSGAGAKVFAYLRAQHADSVLALQALAARGCRTVCYMPEVAAGQPAPVPSPHIVYARGPVNLTQALQDCQLVLAHGGESTLAQALMAGKPALLLPMQTEQYLTAQGIEGCGLGLNAGSRPRPVRFEDLLDQLLQPGACAPGLRAFADRHAGFNPQAQSAELYQAVLTLARSSPGA